MGNSAFMVINEKDWEKATPEQRDWMIFNTLQNMNSRLRVLEKRPLWDKAILFAGGIFGGALVGTLNNVQTVGDPGIFFKMYSGGTAYAVPGWAIP